MKKIFCLLMCAAIALSLAACGGSPTPETDKAAGLRAQYPIYDKAVKEIQSKMSVTAEQADDIFIVLTGCGMDKEISYIMGNDSSYTVNVGKVGEGVTNYIVKLDNGIVSEVKDGGKMLYPAPTIEDMADGSEDVAPDTIESAVDSAIEKAGATKDNVIIGNGVVSIYLKGTGNLTTNMVRNGMFIEARDILKALQERGEITKIALFWTFPLVDKLGNEEESVMKLQLEKETLLSINFDKFDWNNFPDIADDYFEHTALSE